MYSYKDIINNTKLKALEFEGKVLVDFFVEIVEPEFNIAFLVFNDSIYYVCGTIGSEVLTINKVEDDSIFAMNSQFKRFDPYSIFINKKIIQTRIIGEEWNGHGLELSFEGIYDKNMIIQSIYAGDKPDCFEDCIKLGISKYFYSSECLK